MDVAELKRKFEVFFLEGWTSYVSIAAALFVVLAIVGFVSIDLIKDRADEMTQSHIIGAPPWSQCAGIEGNKLTFLQSQRTEIQSFGNRHRKNAIAYFGYFYTTYLVITIFGLIAAICLAVITKAGISGSSPHVLAVFVISTAIVLLYQGSFDILKQKPNLDLNADASIKYAVLAAQIDTYCNTGKISMKDPSDVLLAALPKAEGNSADNKPGDGGNQTGKILPFFVEPDGDQFINFVAWKMDRLRSFAITVDDTKIGAIDTKRFMF